MKIHDRIYGEVEIAAGVLTELIQTKPLTRLQRINQAGPSMYLAKWKTVSRFEHSVGVMLLLRKFGATITEQVAGLLHDVPHTAFSHVADFVFVNEHHEFHELYHEQIITKSEIPEILKRHKISPAVIQPHKFGLLERPIPDLCADRIDYALRDGFLLHRDFHRLNLKLAGLTVRNGEFMFSNLPAAMAFATDFLELDTQAWANPREAAVYELLAQAISHALEIKILTFNDLFADDLQVMSILQQRGDAFIQKKLKYLTPDFRIEPASKNHHHLFVKTKVRWVDPKIVSKNKVLRLTQISKLFLQQIEKHIIAGAKGWYINVYTK